VIGFDDLAAALAERKRRLLLVAETALPASQFAAFRKVLLDELGESGLLADLRGKRPHASGRKPDGTTNPRG
jgi:hypothetical protein